MLLIIYFSFAAHALSDHIAILSNWRTDKRQYFHRFLDTDKFSQERIIVQDSLSKEFEEYRFQSHQDSTTGR